MKNRNTVWGLLGGMVLGVSLAFCLGATDKTTEPAKPDWSHLQIVTYPSGTTGIFNPDNGRIYMYDVDIQHCYAIRELTALGEPMIRRKN